MAEKNEKKPDSLPNVGKGVGGAERVKGLLNEEKAVDSKKTLLRLLKSLNPFMGLFIISIVLTLIGALAQIFAPKYVGQIITLMTRGLIDTGKIEWNIIFSIMGILVVLYLIRFVVIYFSSTTMVKITQKIIASLRKEIDKKLNNLPLNYFDTSSSGDILSLLTNDLDNILNTLQTGFTSAISAIVIMIGVFIMMMIINPILTIVSISALPISSFVVKRIIKKAKPIFTKNASNTGKLNGRIEEVLQSENLVKYYDMEDEVKKEVNILNDKLYETEWKSQYISFMARPAGDLMMNINYVLIALLGGYYVMNGMINIGNFQAFISYSKMFTSPFQQVLGIFNTIMGALASAERIYEFLDEDEVKELGFADFNEKDVKGNISFEEVEFSYVKDKPLFKNYSLEINKGQQIAIVGTTGAGKTTLVNLLMRFYEINSGKILLDGTNINSYKLEEYRKGFSMVLQDTWLFEGTIRENIAYGYSLSKGENLKDVPIEEIERAAKMASADYFISRLPNKYETVLNEGATNISQGQRQLITIARAIIKKAPIIILDEATSSVDTRTEVLIQKGMKALASNSTSFIIAHRLSTIRDANKILVMDNGSIIESGNHDELIKKQGKYAELYEAGQMA